MSTGARPEAVKAAQAAIEAAARLILHKPDRAASETQAKRTPPDPDRLAAAFAFAAVQHKTQVRKATDVPYITHLMSVASIVGEHGGSEDEMVAALLHDTVEDTGCTFDEIERRFGARVREIVAGCTDGDPSGDRHQQPWIERKKGYVLRAAEEPLYVARVSASDKLHNLRSILADLHADPVEQKVFCRFRAGKTGTLWYYRALADVFAAVAASPEADDGFRRLAAQLTDGVSQLETLAKE